MATKKTKTGKAAKTPTVRLSKSIPEESTGFVFWQVNNMWQRAVNAALQAQDITHVQFVILASIAWLGRGEEQVTQVRVARHARTDVMMTSKVVRTLEDKGLLTRSNHPTDTRAKCVALTPTGASVLQRAFRVVEKVDAEFFSVLGGSADMFLFHLNNLILANREEQ